MGKVHQIDDVCRDYHGDNANSKAANEHVHPTKKAMQSCIYDYISSRGKVGATCQEVERDLGLKHQTASARMAEMKVPGHEFGIFWNGLKRALPGSRAASAYVTSRGQLFLLET